MAAIPARALPFALFGLALAASSAEANPQNGTVVGGRATITQPAPGNVTVKQQSSKAIINWKSFSVGKHESVLFKQPNSSSVALNRVTGNDLSTIAGSLSANGIVFLVNPNGVVFTRTAKVDVNGLIATTSDIANKDFMAGKFSFTVPGSQGSSVVNQGKITAAQGGLVGLVAPSVRNDGVITARLGRIALASGDAFTVDLYGDQLVQFAVPAVQIKGASPSSGPLVSNTGTISASGGTISLTADTAARIVDEAINSKGLIEASAVHEQGGEIVLDGGPKGGVAVAGVLDASGKRAGQAGGAVKVLGANVALNAGAKIDVSGGVGGGIALIGGNFHGAGPEHNAATTIIAAKTAIDADALTSGNGGQVAVWSDQSTTFNGNISARGGTILGNGGFVEVSGHQHLAYGGAVDLRAPAGLSGTLLLDPENVTIAATGDTPTLPTSGDTTLTGTADNSVLAVSTLQNALSLGNVTVQTGTTGTQAGDIEVATNIGWGNGNSLTLSAYRNLMIDNRATISNTGSGNLSLRAANTGTGIGTVVFNGTGKVDFSQSTGSVSIYYNPVDNPTGSAVNAVSYTSPIDYSPSVLVNNNVPNQLTAYMLVNSVSDLQNIENNVSGSYALGRDIDASGTAAWNSGAGFRPIGNAANPFTGTLNGLGRQIDNLTINDSTDLEIGLFGEIGSRGSVSSVTLANASAAKGTPLIIGWSRGIVAGTNNGTIKDIVMLNTDDELVGINNGSIVGAKVDGINLNITSANSIDVGAIAGLNTGSISQASAKGIITVDAEQAEIGGLVGQNGVSGQNTGIVSLSNSSVAVTAKFAAPVSVGGLVGLNFGVINNSGASGYVSAAAGSQAGGLVGVNIGTISQSFAQGNVTVSNGDSTAMAGGLVGGNAGKIVQSYATGAVSSDGQVGGLVGINADYGTIAQSYATGAVTGNDAPQFDNSDVGGLVGFSWKQIGDSAISESYATGKITASPSDANTTGGFIGVLSGSTVSTSYWNVETTGKALGVGPNSGNASGISGLTSAQLKFDLPMGFDSAIWSIRPDVNGGYPYLKWQTASSGGGGSPPTPTPTVVNFGTGAPPPVLTELTWSVANVSSTYGTLALLGSDALFGVAPSDGGSVIGAVGLFKGNTPVTLSPTLSAGTYNEEVTGLTGSAASKYTLSPTGDTVGTLTVNPKMLTWMVANASATFGQVPTLGALTLTGVLPADTAVVSGTIGLFSGSAPISLSNALPVGGYSEKVTALTGLASSNYVLAITGNSPGILIVSSGQINPPPPPGAVTWSVGDASSTYGSLAMLGTVTLFGVSPGDAGSVFGLMSLFNGNVPILLSSTLPAGTYKEEVTGLTGQSAGNYILSPNGDVVGTLVVNPKALTWAVANASSIFGTVPTRGAATLDGVLASDSANVFGTVGVFNGSTLVPLSNAIPAGSYSEKITTLTGLASSNYTLAGTGNTPGTLTINPTNSPPPKNNLTLQQQQAVTQTQAETTTQPTISNVPISSDRNSLLAVPLAPNITPSPMNVAGISELVAMMKQRVPQIANFLSDSALNTLLGDVIKLSGGMTPQDFEDFVTGYLESPGYRNLINQSAGKSLTSDISEGVIDDVIVDFGSQLAGWIARKNGASAWTVEFDESLVGLTVTGLIDGPQAEAISAGLQIAESVRALTIQQIDNFNSAIAQANAIAESADALAQKDIAEGNHAEAAVILGIAAKERQAVADLYKEHPYLASMSVIANWF